MRRIVVFVLATLATAACTSSPSGPAPVDYRGGAGATSPPNNRFQSASPSAAPAPLPARPHPSAAAPDWADGPGTPLSAFALTPEEAHPFDPRALPPTYVVAPGDTLFSVSERFQLPIRALIDTNRLAAPFALKQGATINLPPPRLHTVERGETLLSLARRFAIDPRSLALLNRLSAPYVVRTGDVIVLPARARPPAAALPPPPTPTKTAQRSAGAPAPVAAVKPAGAPTLVWPVAGEIAIGFGPQPGGRRSDGLDIAASPGSPIRAAAEGRVVYAGEDLPGYGKLLLVQHAGDWVTAYAHCASFMVTEGARVKRGDVIAEVGRAPSGEPRLHFQLRRGANATDPLPALPKA
jgi:murein DD-endopeptidase MepM/ murein hydrolase activator NlpD